LTAKTRWIGGALWGVNLCSISACTFSYIYLSYYVYRITGSVILSELILFVPMVMPVVFVYQIHRLSQCFSPRALMVWGNIFGVLTCAITFGTLRAFPYAAVLGATAIGTLDALQRVSRIVAIKLYFNSEQVKLTVPLTLTAQFIAGGLAGSLMSVFKDQMTPSIALVLTFTLFVFAVLFGLAIPEQQAVPSVSAVGIEDRPIRHRLATLMRHSPGVTRHFFAFVLFVTFFQGFFNVSRIALPAHQLGLPARFVGLLQVVNSGAALFGALAFYWRSRSSAHVSAIRMAILSGAAMIAACATTNVLSSYGMYFAYIFFFELAFFQLQSELVSSCPPADMPLVATAQYAAVYIGMMTAIAVGAVLADRIGLFGTALAFAVAYMVLRWLLDTHFAQRCGGPHKLPLP
jgi:hypothetical protein